MIIITTQLVTYIDSGNSKAFLSQQLKLHTISRYLIYLSMSSLIVLCASSDESSSSSSSSPENALYARTSECHNFSCSLELIWHCVDITADADKVDSVYMNDAMMMILHEFYTRHEHLFIGVALFSKIFPNDNDRTDIHDTHSRQICTH